MDVYDTLLALEEAPNQRLTMSELADRVVLSPSGVTRLVDRLVKQGLVKREANPDDGRSSFAAITPAGLNLRLEVWPHLQDALTQEFASKISLQQADQLSCMLRLFLQEGVGTSIYTEQGSKKDVR